MKALIKRALIFMLLTLKLAAIFATSFTIALSGALMPGPLLTITVADSARRGARTGPLLILGHGILELSLIIAIVAGLGPILKEHIVIGAIALLGGCTLLWMGSGMLRSAATITLDTRSPAGGGKMNSPVIAGILGSLSNPYWIIWWATIGLGYLITAREFGPVGIGVFFVGHIMADFIWYTAISYGISRGRKLFTDAHYRAVIRVCGIILIIFGAIFLHMSGAHLLSL